MPAHHHSSSSRSAIAAGHGIVDSQAYLHVEPSPIHFRIFLRPQAALFDDAGQAVYDKDDLFVQSRNAFLVWEGASKSPRVAFPISDVAPLLQDKGSERHGLVLTTSLRQSAHAPSPIGAKFYNLVLDGQQVAEDAAWTIDASTPLTNESAKDAPSPAQLVVIRTQAFPQTWEENSVQIGGVRNPYHRVDLLPSTRHVQVYAVGKDGITRFLVADTAHAQPPQRHFALFETGLPTRWYLPASAVEGALKQLDGASIAPSFGSKAADFPSDGLTTKCPYKGVAYYHQLTLPDGDKLSNLIWSYPDPIISFDARGLICFWTPGSDRLRLVVDGEEVT